MLVGGGRQTEIESVDDCFRCRKRKNCDNIKNLEYSDIRKQYLVEECTDIEPLTDDELAQRIGK